MEIPNATITTHHWSPLDLWEYSGFLTGNKEQRHSFSGEEESGDPRGARRGRTKDDEARVGVGGAQRVLGRAAVHGAVELGRDPLQHQLLAVVLGAAVQQAAAHARPREQRLREHLVLQGQGSVRGEQTWRWNQQIGLGLGLGLGLDLSLVWVWV